ncbi:MAG: 2-oxo-4-hydroxy-4-carboxy-5-ureidoimidazoline decarboxylase, partial [Deltaproteobacteria bacterium]
PWISDTYHDDVPYWIKSGERDQLVIPYTLDANDMRFATPQGFNSGDQFFSYLKDSFDTLYAEGGRMMSIGLHCRLVGRPGRAAALRRFIEYAQGHKGVWFARRIEIAEHWGRVNPAVAPNRPSQMTRPEFVAAYGDVFEHSPWVAERAFALELGAAHDRPEGLWNALARAFRSADDDERLRVLRAHPDLAGKLAAAKRLTKDSTAEQASAGLDALTDAERSTFTDLNGQYVKAFGFPFIIAVKDNTKASILAAFTARLENTKDIEFAEACRQVERIAWHRVQGFFA